jgi:hypothetical protein
MVVGSLDENDLLEWDDIEEERAYVRAIREDHPVDIHGTEKRCVVEENPKEELHPMKNRQTSRKSRLPPGGIPLMAETKCHFADSIS